MQPLCLAVLLCCVIPNICPECLTVFCIRYNFLLSTLSTSVYLCFLCSYPQLQLFQDNRQSFSFYHIFSFQYPIFSFFLNSPLFPRSNTPISFCNRLIPLSILLFHHGSIFLFPCCYLPQPHCHIQTYSP